jgi:3-phosphoglycerate kinase
LDPTAVEKLSVRELEVKEGRVFVRVGFNVPTEQIEGNITIRVTALADRRLGLEK